MRNAVKVPGCSTLARGALAAALMGVLSAFAAGTVSAAVPVLSSPADGATVAQLNATHKEYYGKTTAQRRAIDDVGEGKDTYRQKLINQGTCFPLKTTFSWTGTGPFCLEIRRAADQSVFFKANDLAAKSVGVDNFEIGTAYVWAVSNASGFSAWRTFTTEATGPRLLNGASEYVCTNHFKEGASYDWTYETATPHGVRDLGGYTGLDGRRSRQGLLIRSSQLNTEYSQGGQSRITDKNRAFWKEFIPVKTEIDLRNSTESKIKVSPLGSDVTYKQFTHVSAAPKYLTANMKNDVRDIIKWCADASHYPIDFHCVHGKDRTGFLAMVFGALLGYDEDTILKDYEATMFWNPWQPSSGLIEFEDYFKTNRVYNTSTVSLNQGVYNFVKKIGVSDTEITAFRNIMLEPLKDDPVVVTKVAKPTFAAIWARRDGENHKQSVAVTPAGAYTVEYSNGGNWTAVGDYTATCRLTDTTRYAWTDGTKDDVVLSFAVIDRYDYLESDGHGYLLTDYPFDIAKTHVELKFQLMADQEETKYANQSFFWIDNATSGDEWGCTQWDKGGGISYYYNSGEASVVDALPDFENPHTIRAWGNTVQFDANAPVTGTAAAPASLPHVNLMLFASRDCERHRVQYEARIRVDSFKVWEEDEANPVRNYVAVKRADGSSTFFDTVTGVYLDPSTGVFVAGNREHKADAGRFIQTDGKGYFDLGFRPHLRNTRIEIVSTLDPNQGGQGILWAGSSKVMGLCAYPNDGALTYYATRVGGTGEGDGVSCANSCRTGDRTVHTMTVGGSSFVIDGVETPCGYETADAEADGNAILFLNEYQGEPAVKLYSVKVWDVSQTPAALVHSFVPGTSADQLYDEVGGTSVTAQRVTSGTAYSFAFGHDEPIDLSTVTTEFDYDNEEKRPLPESEEYTLLGDVAKSAPGTYTVRVVPNGGYCWSDGSHAAQTIEWTINGSWNPVATDFGISNRITVAEQDYCVLTFTNTAAGWNWTVPAGVTEFEFLVAAGGGGGGAGNDKKDYCRTGGGGGAGGVVTGRVANASGTFTVKVGAGGARGATLGASGANGGDSSLKLGGVNYVTAKGGGAGGGARYVNTTDTGSDGAAGGSGGGGSASKNVNRAGGATAAAEVGGGVTAWQSFGNAGGSGYSKRYAGGGGGATGAGESASAANAKNGEGGAGLVSPISGELATYGCGGGTAYYGAAGDGAAATAATGNGGRGGYGDDVGFYGEAGGSGVVVIRYAASAQPAPPPEVDTYDWLQADGNGYIETDYVPNLKKTRIEVVYEQTSHDSGFFWMANACTEPGGSGSGRQMCNLSLGLHGAAGEELQYGQANESDEHEMRYGTPERYVVVTNVTQGADVWRNGVHGAMSGYTADDVLASGPLVLFAGNWAGKYADGKKAMLKAKVYRVTISEVDGATAEVRYNFVPATDAYGRATMYDTVSGQFAAVLGDEAGYTVGNGYPTKPEPEPTPDPTATVAPVAVAPADGATVDILTPTQRQFLAKSAAERRADYVSQAQRRNLGSWDYGYCDPQPLTLRWKGENDGNAGRCTVRVWRVKDGVETLHFEREVLGYSTTVDNFEVAADYRWEVANAVGTAGGTFTTRDETPRLLRDPDPQQRITGIRDLGGRIGLDGRRVKQNLVFRSSRLSGPESLDENFVTDANRSWWRDTLKIKTDLDLRSVSEVGVWTKTPIPDATWKHVSSSAYANFVNNPASFKTCFKLFLDANNYPFVFHCVAGQDRTGCLAFVLESLLGVDADECLKDWEANAFRNSDVTWNHEAGIDMFIASFDDEAGDTLTERIVSWVKRQGYSDDDINRFRELMLEPAPVVPVERYDYLQGDGTGFILTDYTPSCKSTRIVVEASVAAPEGCGYKTGSLFSTVGNEDDVAKLFFNLYLSNAGEVAESTYYYFPNKYSGTGTADGGVAFAQGGARFTVAVKGNAISINGGTPVAAQDGVVDKKTNGALVFFSDVGNSGWTLTARIYFAAIYEDDGNGGEKLVHRYLPCKDGDGRSGLWDEVDNRVWLPSKQGTKGIVDYSNEATFYAANEVGDPIQRKVVGAKSGESVLPAEVALGDVELAADGKSFEYGGKTYAKEHYVFQAKGETLIAVIASAEAAITSAGVGETGGLFKIGTIDATVEGFRYAVEYADVLGGDWTVYSVSKPGEGKRLVLEAPMSDTGDHRFYRIVVTDAE